MAVDFDIRDPKNQKIIMTFLIPVVIIAAFFQFMVRPVKEDVAAKKVELTAIQNQLDTIKRSLKTPKVLEEEQKQLVAKLKELESFLPDEENVAVLLNQFSMVEREANVYLVGFNIAESVEGGERPYKANRYRMTIEAGYHQFADFIAKLMALPRIMSFSDLRISVNPMQTEETESYEGLENQPRNLTIDCLLTTYLYQKVSPQTETSTVKRR